MGENTTGQFVANYEQVGPFHFKLGVVTPDGTKFSLAQVAQCNPSQMNAATILAHFREKSNWKDWICELEEIKPKPFLLEHDYDFSI